MADNLGDRTKMLTRAALCVCFHLGSTARKLWFWTTLIGLYVVPSHPLPKANRITYCGLINIEQKEPR